MQLSALFCRILQTLLEKMRHYFLMTISGKYAENTMIFEDFLDTVLRKLFHVVRFSVIGTVPWMSSILISSCLYTESIRGNFVQFLSGQIW